MTALAACTPVHNDTTALRQALHARHAEEFRHRQADLHESVQDQISALPVADSATRKRLLVGTKHIQLHLDPPLKVVKRTFGLMAMASPAWPTASRSSMRVSPPGPDLLAGGWLEFTPLDDESRHITSLNVGSVGWRSSWDSVLDFLHQTLGIFGLQETRTPQPNIKQVQKRLLKVALEYSYFASSSLTRHPRTRSWRKHWISTSLLIHKDYAPEALPLLGTGLSSRALNTAAGHLNWAILTLPQGKAGVLNIYQYQSSKPCMQEALLCVVSTLIKHMKELGCSAVFLTRDMNSCLPGERRGYSDTDHSMNYTLHNWMHS
eukprot:532442-Rhodomonas_salina.3